MRNRKKVFKKLFIRFKPYILILTVIGVISVINSEKYMISKKLYDTGYSMYGNAVIFLRSTYEDIFKKSDDDSESFENAYLEQKYAAILSENELLKKQLNLIENVHYKYLSAWITQVTHPKGENSVAISAGKKDGVKIGNIVVNEHGIVGRVSDVSESFAVVSLLGNDNVRLSAIILPSYQNCIVGGNSDHEADDLKLSVSYLNEINAVKDGDSVISSGKDGLTPFGLKIGTIHKSSDGKIFVLTKKQSLDSLIVQVIISY